MGSVEYYARLALSGVMFGLTVGFFLEIIFSRIMIKMGRRTVEQITNMGYTRE